MKGWYVAAGSQGGGKEIALYQIEGISVLGSAVAGQAALLTLRLGHVFRSPGKKRSVPVQESSGQGVKIPLNPGVGHGFGTLAMGGGGEKNDLRRRKTYKRSTL